MAAARTEIIRRNKIDKEIAQAFRVHFNCVTIHMLEIPKIYDRARMHVNSGGCVNEVLKELALEYKKVSLQ